MLPDGTPLGRYRTIRIISEGGFGEVYLAEDTLIQRNVAIKVIKPQQNPHKLKEAIRLFQREMKAVAQLDHPHILPLYDFGEATVNGTEYAYMVMPYCKDGTLETWLDERKDNHFPFPSLPDVAQILSQAADALQQAHDHPDKILHLDVKPANFLIRDNKENPNCPYLLLADFGIAKFVDASAGFSTTVRGSIEYMPSEQSRSNPQCASDQYALALMIYKILTYQLPFRGDYAQLLYQHLEVIAQPPSTLNPRIPPEIDAVILKALAKDYEERYPTVITFADAFKEALVNNAATRVILSISKTEAETGRSYPLKLTNGRQITVAIPAGVKDGDEIRQEGLGIASYEGDFTPALIITITIKPESESERKLAGQLQVLEQEIQALRANPPTDQKLMRQIQQLSQNVTNSQAQALNNDQGVTIQLQSITNGIAALQAKQDILKQDIAKDISTLQALFDQIVQNQLIPSSKENVIVPSLAPIHNQKVGAQPDELPQEAAGLRPNPKTSFAHAIAGHLAATPKKNAAISSPTPMHSRSLVDQPADTPPEAADLQPDPQTNVISANTPSPAPKTTDKFLASVLVILVIAIILLLIIGIPATIYQQQQNTDATATVSEGNAATAIVRNATATTIATYPYPSYLPGHGTIALHDSLDGTNNYYQWNVESGCNFSNKTYHVISPQRPFRRTCTAASTYLSNFALEVSVTINNGDCGGVSFREDISNTNYYFFLICPNQSFDLLNDGQYDSPRFSSLAINPGLGQTNILTVVANGNQIIFYVNQKKLGNFNDSTYIQGQIGFLADNYGSSTTDVSYTNVKVWTLP